MPMAVELCALSSSTRQSISQLAMRRPKTLITASVLLAIALALSIQHAVISSRTDARIARLSESGLPITLAELDDSYSLPAGATNAADFYLPAFDSMTGSQLSNSDPLVANTNAPIFHKIKPRRLICVKCWPIPHN